MIAGRVVAALTLPEASRVDQRIPKTLLAEQAAATAADRRQIKESLEALRWLAALKPTTIGVPAHRDEIHEYLEIAVLHAGLRTGARAGRLIELIHRAVPYPVFLIVDRREGTAISLAHKRLALNEAGRMVLEDGFPQTTAIPHDAPEAFFDALALHNQPGSGLLALYQGWLDVLIALETFQRTGRFQTAGARGTIPARHQALHEVTRLEAEIARLRKHAARERQIARQVELNMEIKRLEARREAGLERLTKGVRET